MHTHIHTRGLGGPVVSALNFQAVIVGSNPTRAETIFRPLIRLAHTRRALS